MNKAILLTVALAAVAATLAAFGLRVLRRDLRPASAKDGT